MVTAGLSTKRVLRSLVPLLAFAAPFATSAAEAACRILPEPPGARASSPRALQPQDLIRLRDIGFPDASVSAAPDPLAVSSDGRQVAFIISQADPETNSYCRALIVLPLTASGQARVLDRGGEYEPVETPARGLLAILGAPRTGAPAWAPDGRSIAYLKRIGGVTQIWLARPRGYGGRMATHEPASVDAFAWSGDGRSLIYSSRRAREMVERALDREGQSGWLYDERVTPNAGARPRIRDAEAPLQYFSLDLATGRVTAASAHERSRLSATSTADAAATAAANPRRRAWTQPRDDALLAQRQLWATDQAGAPVRCDAEPCTGGVAAMWWSPDAGELWFLRQEGWRGGTTALYRWRPGAGEPVRALATSDVLRWCDPAEGGLVCTRESTTTPRRIARVDPRSGTVTDIFDPNPEFRTLTLGTVRRLQWRNDQGLPAWGDLVLPADQRPGQRLPMVVVQYHSRGFLRGGTDDEYPVFLFAARGFAVLSFERPPPVASLFAGLRTAEELNKVMFKDWAERWSIQSALAEGVKAAVATGAVDPERIGITGLSDGATAARFALINSRIFSAASISSCCIEPMSSMAYGGIAFAEFNRKIGLPGIAESASDIWRPASLAMNAERIDTPLLMQLADDEYLLSLEAFEALREKGKPVEMYVFPDEHHGKWQPVHRLAIYNRNLDWFRFWLKGEEDADPAKVGQYRRWRTMKARLRGSAGS